MGHDLLLPNLPTRVASQTVIAEVELKGRDPAGGPEVTTPVFRFPIVACNGCLVDFTGANDFVAKVQPNCYKLAAADLRKPCFLGQDEAVPCQLCVGQRNACDPTTP
jgi:hypothetical protein